MLTIREYTSGDVMLTVTVFPIEIDTSDIEQQLCRRFISIDTFACDQFRVTSMYWQVLANASDPAIYRHIGGIV